MKPTSTAKEAPSSFIPTSMMRAASPQARTVAPVISSVSNRKALRRSPAGATTNGSDSPSGVSTRWMRALSREIALMAPAHKDKVPAPEAQGRGGEGPAEGAVVHGRAEDPLDHPRHQEHGDRAHRQQRDLPPAQGEV